MATTRNSVLDELSSWREMAALVIDPIFYGVGAARGDGRTAVVIPGLFGNDIYLQPLRSFLGRIGYRPLQSTIQFNAGCPQRMREVVTREINRATPQQRFVLIGHSRGGLLARAIAAEMQDRVSHLVTLGSPVRMVSVVAKEGWERAVESTTRMSPVAELGLAARRAIDPNCDFPKCGCAYVSDLQRAISPRTALLAMFTASDPIVPAEFCRTEEGENLEVRGSHSGLAHNASVYRALAAFLANQK